MIHVQYWIKLQFLGPHPPTHFGGFSSNWHNQFISLFFIFAQFQVFTAMPPKRLRTPPPLSTSPRFWGLPPPLQKGKGKGEGKGRAYCSGSPLFGGSTGREWRWSYSSRIDLLADFGSYLDYFRISATGAQQFELLWGRITENVAFLTGSPNSGKSTLATSLARVFTEYFGL